MLGWFLVIEVKLFPRIQNFKLVPDGFLIEARVFDLHSLQHLGRKFQNSDMCYALNISIYQILQKKRIMINN
jgi:hypothetical protein